jgi:hypothetical protein
MTTGSWRGTNALLRGVFQVTLFCPGLRRTVLYKYDIIYTDPSNNAILPSLAGVPSSSQELKCFSECCLDTIKVLFVEFTFDGHVVYSEIDDPISYLQY